MLLPARLCGFHATTIQSQATLTCSFDERNGTASLSEIVNEMTQPNRRLGERPVDLILEHGFEGLLAVRRYLDFQRGQ